MYTYILPGLWNLTFMSDIQEVQTYNPLVQKKVFGKQSWNFEESPGHILIPVQNIKFKCLFIFC